jgi:ABC-type branched-subunit amino acid transport system permease subunit
VVLVVAAAAVATLPAVLGAGDLTDVTLSVTRAAVAAGAAVALAAGRPSLAMAGLGGVAAYTSGLAAMHGWSVPLAVLAGIGMATLAGVLLGLLGARLGGAAFAAFTLVATLAGGALVAAIPGVFGGSGGLQLVPVLSLPLPNGDTLAFTGEGMLHVVLALCGLAVLGAGLVLIALPGARWRAVGGDPERAAAAGLHPLRRQLAALAVAGVLPGWAARSASTPPG